MIYIIDKNSLILKSGAICNFSFARKYLYTITTDSRVIYTYDFKVKDVP